MKLRCSAEYKEEAELAEYFATQKKIIVANEITAAKNRIAKLKTIVKVAPKTIVKVAPKNTQFSLCSMIELEKEEAEFLQNEREILPIMHKLNDAVMKKDKKEIFSLLDEIESAVPKIAPSFIELHQIGMLIKRTRKTFSDDPEVKVKAHMITDAMKMVYNDKVDRRPKGIILRWEACDNKLKQDENKLVDDGTEDPSTFPERSQPLSIPHELKPTNFKSNQDERILAFMERKKESKMAERVASQNKYIIPNENTAVKRGTAKPKTIINATPKMTKFSLRSMIQRVEQSISSPTIPHAVDPKRTSGSL